MELSEELRRRWERIIEDTTKTDIPLECIKKILIKLKGGKQKTINLELLRKKGFDLDDIEESINETFTEFESDIRDIDFVVDISAVAALVQPETDKLLKKLNQ